MAHERLSEVTLKDMMFDAARYSNLPEWLVKFPVPMTIRIGKKRFAVPDNYKEFINNVCYGQRIFFAQKEENDFGLILRVMDGYYFPIVKKQKWDADLALLFGKEVLNCIVEELYPVAMHLLGFVGQMIEREKELLYREPSKIELAAGIEKLNVFADLTSLDFLRDAMKVTVPEVLLTPYNECLVRFMIAKETNEFQDRYYKLLKEESEANLKHKYSA